MLVEWFGGPGGDRLFRGLGRSIMGAGGFHGRVRDGIGCGPSAEATRSSKPRFRWQASVISARAVAEGWGLTRASVCVGVPGAGLPWSSVTTGDWPLTTVG